MNNLILAKYSSHFYNNYCWRSTYSTGSNTDQTVPTVLTAGILLCARKKFGTYLFYLFQSLVVIQKEAQVLIRNIHIAIATFFPVFFQSLLSARKRVLVDLKTSA